jgi:hypothetical protein
VKLAFPVRAGPGDSTRNVAVALTVLLPFSDHLSGTL